ncbi:DUF4230 domain-containing protein [Carboxylicivirga sp. N1Y90]|uniref:DUF4230 domain-containing protein n=1 Tax=Carboxylicivirga fragile TaxID=3417571 RepID=UPI003D354A32|nr:DUF4230 domain-containing protein [Marinilabiliaceae bacterium N1Y90]
MLRFKQIAFVLLATSMLLACKREKRWLVISKIKSTAKLATTQTTIDKVVIGNKQRKAFGLVRISSSDFVAYSEATVLTGIDLTKLDRKDVEIDGDVIELKLPAVEVLDFNYPFEKFEIDHHLSNNKFMSTIDVIDMESFFRQAESDIREHLKYMGITEQTEENTRKMLEGLLKNMGYKEIYIEFKNDSTELIPKINWDKYLNSND